ncbi:MAG: hypothetical protein WBX15_02710 [Thermoanaerobaculia bacterium]
MKRSFVPGIVLFLSLAGALHAASGIDQEQVTVDLSVGGVAVGGGSAEKLAQVFTAATTGCLTHVTIPIGCDPSETLVVEIQATTAGVPNGTVLASETLPGSLFPSISPSSLQGGFRIIGFTRPAPVTAGTEYAIVLLGGPAGCGVFQGPAGDPYAGGHGWFDARPNPPGWIQFFSGRDDLPFQTFVETGIRGKCKKCR